APHRGGRVDQDRAGPRAAGAPAERPLAPRGAHAVRGGGRRPARRARPIPRGRRAGCAAGPALRRHPRPGRDQHARRPEPGAALRIRRAGHAPHGADSADGRSRRPAYRRRAGRGRDRGREAPDGTARRSGRPLAGPLRGGNRVRLPVRRLGPPVPDPRRTAALGGLDAGRPARAGGPLLPRSLARSGAPDPALRGVHGRRLAGAGGGPARVAARGAPARAPRGGANRLGGLLWSQVELGVRVSAQAHMRLASPPRGAADRGLFGGRPRLRTLAAASAVAALALALPSAGRADIINVGSDLAGKANLIEAHGADSAFWNV